MPYAMIACRGIAVGGTLAALVRPEDAMPIRETDADADFRNVTSVVNQMTLVVQTGDAVGRLQPQRRGRALSEFPA